MIRVSSPLSMVLASRSGAFFWATVKSALPTEMMAAADCSRPLLVTASVTTVITAKAIARTSPNDLAFLDQRFQNANAGKVMVVLSPGGPGPTDTRRGAWPDGDDRTTALEHRGDSPANRSSRPTRRVDTGPYGRGGDRREHRDRHCR